MSRQFNATQIKYAMAALMVLDHLPHIPGLIPPFWAGIIHALTRCVAVWFAYGAVEGFIHTRNLKDYTIRLWGWALFMAVGNFLLNWLFEYRDIAISNNIFLTLALGVTMLSLAFPRQQVSPGRKSLGIILALVLLALGVLGAEGGMVLLPFMGITYLYRQRKGLRNGLYLALALVLFLMSYQAYETWQQTLQMLLFNSDWLFISVIPVLSLYNGQRGPKTLFNKYFFYVFYPAHLWLITLIAYLVSK